ncbi:chorion peroxidase [Nephila pilipes]|uniref:Chorion peroxidase n=1 Tax=Nephila pilipes TaxID=299642 RepID=A0A8X6NZH5_NEPPI|nr:chorion peroxidase [Nephila pilipes]
MRCGLFHHRRIRCNIFKLILALVVVHVDLTFSIENSNDTAQIEKFQLRNLRRYPRQVFFNGIGNGKTSPPSPRVSRIPRISSAELEKYVNRSVAMVERRLGLLEQSIYANGIVLDPGSPSWFAAASAKTKVVAKNISKMALVAEEATRLLTNQREKEKEFDYMHIF